MGLNQTMKTTLQKNARSKKKRFQDVTTKQTNNWPTILFETEYFPFEKNRPWSDSNPGPLTSQAYALPPG